MKVVEDLAPDAAARSWFEQKVVSLLPRLCATACRLCGNPADADDLVAETVAQAWRKLPTLRDRATVDGWLFRILTNVFLAERRAQSARPPLESLDDPEDFSLFERLHQPILLWWGNPEQQFFERLLREDLERAVDGLPEAYRVVVVLADLQGRTYQEIADALELPIGTVRSRLARGRTMLQKALWRHGEDAGLVPGAT